MEVKDIVVGSIWKGNLNKDFIAIVDEIIFGSYQIDVELTIFNTKTAETSTHSFNTTYFIKAYTPLLTTEDLNLEYVKGKMDGYNEGCQHGLTLAKENTKDLDDNELEGIIDDAFQEGYAQAYSELHAPTTERERQLQEKAWGEGYAEGESDILETLNELSRQQAEDCNNIETCDEQLEKELVLVEKYPHYYKDIRHLNIIDIYRFFDLFEVTDPCIQHSMKKMAVGGKRGAKDYEKDIKEAMDTLSRWEYMQEENKRGMND